MNLAQQQICDCIRDLACRAEELGDNDTSSVLWTLLASSVQGPKAKRRLVSYLAEFNQQELDRLIKGIIKEDNEQDN